MDTISTSNQFTFNYSETIAIVTYTAAIIATLFRMYYSLIMKIKRSQETSENKFCTKINAVTEKFSGEVSTINDALSQGKLKNETSIQHLNDEFISLKDLINRTVDNEQKAISAYIRENGVQHKSITEDLKKISNILTQLTVKLESHLGYHEGKKGDHNER